MNVPVAYRCFEIVGHPTYERAIGINRVVRLLRADTSVGLFPSGTALDLAELDVGESIRFAMLGGDPNRERRVTVTRV